MRIVKGKSISGKEADGLVTSVNPQRIYQKGDKIAQLIPCKHNPMSITFDDYLSESDRGEGGFGSTN